LQQLEERLRTKLERRGDILFDQIDDIIVSGLETEVFMTNSEIDVGVTVRNLLELRNGMPPDVAANMTAQALDLLGLEVPQSIKNPQPQPAQGQPMPGGQPNMDALSSGVQDVTTANTMSPAQR
jgi:hypothetical protein